MTSPPPLRPSSHRAATPASVITRRLLPPLAAVTAVAVVILLLVVLNSRPTTPGPGPGAVAEGAASTTSQPPTPSLAARSPAATAATSTAPAPPVSEPPATQAPTHRTAAKPAVTVLNNSRRQGLAAHVAAEVAGRGWPIRQTGNFRGRIATTTAYYPPGGRPDAQALARAFPQVRRVLPRFAGLPGAGLTLVVTRDWSG